MTCNTIYIYILIRTPIAKSSTYKDYRRNSRTANTGHNTPRNERFDAVTQIDVDDNDTRTERDPRQLPVAVIIYDSITADERLR